MWRLWVCVYSAHIGGKKSEWYGIRTSRRRRRRVERPSQRACERGEGSGGIGLSTCARARTERRFQLRTNANGLGERERDGEDAVPLTFFHFLTHLDGCARGHAFVAQNSRFLFKWVDGMPCKRIRDTKNAVLIKVIIELRCLST